MITITRMIKANDGEVWQKFVVSVNGTTKEVPIDTLYGHDALVVMAGNANIEGHNTEWIKDKTFGKDLVYPDLKAFDADEWADEYNARLRRAIKECL